MFKNINFKPDLNSIIVNGTLIMILTFIVTLTIIK